MRVAQVDTQCSCLVTDRDSRRLPVSGAELEQAFDAIEHELNEVTYNGSCRG